jgi:phosphatidylethanolamine-binding protein (PEBP) family uncharacterized protein
MSDLKIFYNNKKITNNEFLTPSETKEQPIIKYNSNDNNLYTLILYDPDSIYGTYIHWAIVNIPEDNINNSTIIVPYLGPQPPSGTGIHNYIFQLYKQSEKKYIKPLEGRQFELEDLKNKLQVSNLITEFVFKSQFESGGTKNKKVKKTKKTKKTKKSKNKRNKRNKNTKRKI